MSKQYHYSDQKPSFEPTRIFFDESRLMQEYERMMDEVFLEYFSFPSDIPDMHLTNAERLDISMNNSLAEELMRLENLGLKPGALIADVDNAFIRKYGREAFNRIARKRVKFHRDKLVNGLHPTRGHPAAYPSSGVTTTFQDFVTIVIMFAVTILVFYLAWNYLF